MQLGVFPLPIFLLPGGITRLRIFEPRYIRLITEAAAGDGFALSVYQPDRPYQSYPIAAHVEIVDFATLDDGLLGVTVKALQLVKLADFEVEDDGLRKAQIVPLSHWPQQEITPLNPHFATTLHELFDSQAELAAHYQSLDYEDPAWVCGRFLEILPLPMEKKLAFYHPASFPQACELLKIVFDIK